MKQSERIKVFPYSLLATLAASLISTTTNAFNYSDSDLLLVFRKDPFRDAEFNLGSVSNYLGKAAGTKLTVSNWDLSGVRANFNNSLASVKFLLVAATAATDPLRRDWCTSAVLNPSTPPTDLSGSRLGFLRSKISAVGIEAATITASNATQSYFAATGDPSSYTYIVSDGGLVDASNIGGLAPFTVEVENPATLLFYELKVSNLAVKPPAAVIGSFSLEATGALTFTAGALQTGVPQPQIVSIARSASTSTVSFTTTNGVNYRLRFTAVLGGGWTTLPTVVVGDGTTKTLTDTATNPQGFYNVEASP